VQEKKSIVTTKNDRGNLQVIPIGKEKWDVQFISGQEEPEIQGWYSEEYNKYEPNVATIYSTRIKTGKTFAWLLVPFEMKMRDISAEIISANAEGVRLRIVEGQRGKWEVFVPYSNSESVQFDRSDKTK
jgi:hypothetical protein